MGEWVRMCGAAELPKPGEVAELEVAGRMLCVANVEGEVRAIDNWCPHREGPLGQGWLEGENVICPWHAWAFSTKTGVAEPPERAEVKVFPLRVEGEDVLVQAG